MYLLNRNSWWITAKRLHFYIFNNRKVAEMHRISHCSLKKQAAFAKQSRLLPPKVSGGWRYICPVCLSVKGLMHRGGMCGYMLYSQSVASSLVYFYEHWVCGCGTGDGIICQHISVCAWGALYSLMFLFVIDSALSLSSSCWNLSLGVSWGNTLFLSLAALLCLSNVCTHTCHCGNKPCYTHCIDSFVPLLLITQWNVFSLNSPHSS